jgi:hypothetical protein
LQALQGAVCRGAPRLFDGATTIAADRVNPNGKL